MYVYIFFQILSLERELEDTRDRAAEFEEEADQQSQGMDLQLLDSQVSNAYTCHFVSCI